MRKSYLHAETLWVPIQPSKKYVNRWQVVDKGEKSGLYVDAGVVRQSEQRPQQAPRDCDEVYTIVDEHLFYQFMTQWLGNRLILYRGFGGCHFCWPHLLEGELRSEGDGDTPSFTMHDPNDDIPYVPTRWLPAVDEPILAEGVSTQGIDRFTHALSLHEPIPVGFTVSIPAGRVHKLSLCWLNAGEILARGPLRLGQYRMHSITWYDTGQPDFRPWPHQIDSDLLPPQRPYQPGRQHEIEFWWERCQWWVNRIALYDPILQEAKRRRDAASNQRKESGAIGHATL